VSVQKGDSGIQTVIRVLSDTQYVNGCLEHLRVNSIPVPMSTFSASRKDDDWNVVDNVDEGMFASFGVDSLVVSDGSSGAVSKPFTPTEPGVLVEISSSGALVHYSHASSSNFLF